MPQSLSNILIHIVFSTKNRIGLIEPGIEPALYPYLATICRSLNCPTVTIGGTKNHVHILCKLARTVSISKLVEKIKTGSSRWIKTKGKRFSNFSWQNGYGAFSISFSNIGVVIKYINEQKKHHEHKTFEAEYLELLQQYKIEHDERYVWE